MECPRCRKQIINKHYNGLCKECFKWVWDIEDEEAERFARPLD